MWSGYEKQLSLQEIQDQIEHKKVNEEWEGLCATLCEMAGLDPWKIAIESPYGGKPIMYNWQLFTEPAGIIWKAAHTPS